MRSTRCSALTASILAVWLASCSGGVVRRNYSAISLSTLTVDFGQQNPGSVTTLTLTVSSVGAVGLERLAATVRNDPRSAFTVTALPGAIAVGESVTVTVTYTAPALAGSDSALWVVDSDAENAPELDVALSGRVVNPCGSGLSQCGASCFDLASDDLNCGKCGTVCAAPDHCVASQCGCRPKRCSDIGECGAAADGCGGTLQCGTCTAPALCAANHCVPPSCADGVKNQAETDVDCGGPCPRCTLTKVCGSAIDCTVGLVCTNNVCSNCASGAECPNQVCTAGLCAACSTAAECGNNRACVSGKCLSCPAEAAFNECNLCGGTPVSGVNSPCVTSLGCSSAFVCNAQLNGVACTTVPTNACNLCNGPAVTGLGAQCTASSGCPSTVACNAAGTGTVCAAVVLNQCGVCGGVQVSGVGSPCVDAGGCNSAYACNAQGDGLTCTPITRNACNVCGGPVVTGVGATCTASSGCASTTACNTAGTATLCTDVIKNACNVCGGPLVTGVGTTCTDGSGCTSTNLCNTAGNGLTCTPIGRNACSVCGGPVVTGVGSSCTASSGCASTRACNTAGDAAICTDVVKNACNVCGGPPVSGVGASCFDPISGCASTFACNGAGTGVVCSPVGRNACNVCGGVTVTGVGSACVASSGCASTLACNGPGDATVCTDVVKNQCNVCGGVNVPNVGVGCAGPTGCAGNLICNGTGDGTTCNAPANCFQANHLVVSRIVGTGPAGSNDEFIELYNPTSSPITVTGYTLWYRTAVSNNPWLAANNIATLAGVVPAHRYLLAVYTASGATYSFPAIPADVGYNPSISATGGQLLVWRTGTTPPTSPTPADADYIDFVGYGTAVHFESAAAPVPGAPGAIVRKASPGSTSTTMTAPGADSAAGNGTDSDNNSADFVTEATFTPRNSSSPAQP